MLAGFSFVFFFSYFSNDCPLVEVWVLLEVEIIISSQLWKTGAKLLVIIEGLRATSS